MSAISNDTTWPQPMGGWCSLHHRSLPCLACTPPPVYPLPMYPYPPTTAPTDYHLAASLRIAAALERIADALAAPPVAPKGEK